MTVPAPAAIRAIVFDLDGTLYVSPEFSAAIQDQAAGYMTGILGADIHETCRLMAATRARLAEESGTVQTLSAVCSDLGGNVRDLHAFFIERLRPEETLNRDSRVIDLLNRLGARLDLYIYTNNNRILTTRIIEHLGFGDCFAHIFTIDDSWQAKPDEKALDRIIDATGLTPDRVLFVGDRYDVDLRLPELRGCPVFLVRSIEQLLRLETLLG